MEQYVISVPYSNQYSKSWFFLGFKNKTRLVLTPKSWAAKRYLSRKWAEKALDNVKCFFADASIKRTDSVGTLIDN